MTCVVYGCGISTVESVRDRYIAIDFLPEPVALVRLFTVIDNQDILRPKTLSQ